MKRKKLFVLVVGFMLLLAATGIVWGMRWLPTWLTRVAPDDGKCAVQITNNSKVAAEAYVSGQLMISISPSQADSMRVSPGCEVKVKVGQKQGKFVLPPYLRMPFVRSIEYEVIVDNGLEVVGTTCMTNRGNFETNVGSMHNKVQQKGTGKNTENGSASNGGASDDAILISVIGDRYFITQKANENQPLHVTDVHAGLEWYIQKGEELSVKYGVTLASLE